MNTHDRATAPGIALLGLLAIAPSAAAQTFYIPDSNPDTGPCNVIPFGLANPAARWSNQRYQCVLKLSDLGNPSAPIRIHNIGFAACGPVGSENISHCTELVIQMAQTTRTRLQPTFADNLQNNVRTVLSTTNYQWHNQGGTWNRIGLQHSYPVDPALGDVVVDICVQGNEKFLGQTSGFHGGTEPRVFNTGWTGTCPATGTVNDEALKICVDVDAWSLDEYGMGCEGLTLRLGGSSRLGAQLDIDVDDRRGTCMLGAGIAAFQPGIDIGNQCMVYVDPAVIVPMPSGTLQGTVPNQTSIKGLRVYWQAYCIDSRYPNDLATSNYGIQIPGVAR